MDVVSLFNRDDEWLEPHQEFTPSLDEENSMAREDGGTSTRYRKLTNLYNSCSIALSAGYPTSYKEAIRSEE